MSRTIITTCGTSLLQSSCWSYNGLNEKQLSEDELDRREHEEKCESTLMEAMDNKKESEVSKSFSWLDTDYLRDLPAELASLRAIQIYFEENEKPIGEGDKVILLHSDNKKGRFCAEILCTVLNNKDINLLPGVITKKKEVTGLDPQDRIMFGKALMRVWKKIILKPDNELRNYIFNLTGGYKAVGILLGGIAYHIAKVPIFYLHEETGYDDITFMCFNKKGDMEKWFYASNFNITKRRIESEIDISDKIGTSDKF